MLGSIEIIRGFTHVQEVNRTWFVALAWKLIGDHDNKLMLVLHSSREENDCFQVGAYGTLLFYISLFCGYINAKTQWTTTMIVELGN